MCRAIPPKRIALLWALSGIVALGPVAATPFQISTCTGCAQTSVAVAGAPSGAFLALWQQTQLNANSVVAKAFPPGQRIPAFTVDGQEPNPPQYQPDVALDTAGNFVVVWGSTANNIAWILAQRFDPTGKPLSDPIEVASEPNGLPENPVLQHPTVATTPTGGFFVSWIVASTKSLEGAPPLTVMARRYVADNTPAAAALSLSTGLALGAQPSICVDVRNRLVATWTFADTIQPFEPSKVGVVMRRYSIHDNPFGPEVVVSPATADSASAAVSCGKHGSFVVAWSSDASDGDVTQVLAQRFSYNGNPFAPPVQVNVTGSGSQNRSPAIEHDSAGNFVVVWDAADATSHRLLARAYSEAGSAFEDPTLLANETIGSPSLAPRFSTIGADRFIVTWSEGEIAFGERVMISAP
jgi:hypothetical protein